MPAEDSEAVADDAGKMLPFKNRHFFQHNQTRQQSLYSMTEKMTEFQKMRSGMLFDFTDKEVLDSIMHSKQLCAKIRQMSEFDEGYRNLIEELIPGIPKSSIVISPITCDHGNGVKLGEHTFVNSNCTFLDGGYITIGDHTLIGPDCRFLTHQHPMNYLERKETKETDLPIKIGKDCWIGGNVTVCPGVTIGDRSIIGAGSVVTKDIPNDCVAVGNPARVIKRNENKV